MTPTSPVIYTPIIYNPSIASPISPISPTLSVNLTYSKPLISLYYDYGNHPRIQEMMIKYFYYKVLDKWLLDELSDILNYFTYKNGQVALIKDLSQYKPTNINEDTDTVAHEKIKYIEKNFFNKYDMTDILAKFVLGTGIRWSDLMKNEYGLRQAVREFFLRRIKEKLKSHSGGIHSMTDKTNEPIKSEKKNTDFFFESVGTFSTSDYKVYLFKKLPKYGKSFISPFHDIPLWIDEERGIVNMIVEIPQIPIDRYNKNEGQAKLEINKEEKFNPIMHDIKDNKVRYVKMRYPGNYGALPQTWENPNFIDPHTKVKGDNDPIDAIDITSIMGAKPGQVKQVKILGSLAMIDNNETDWKVICLDINDPKANSINDLDDIKKYMPEKLDEVHKFFRDYKISDGEPQNQFAFDSQPQKKDFTLNIVKGTHEEWFRLIAGKEKAAKISIVNTTNCGTPGFVIHDS
jgi:inorganic pyrophosphatase